MQRRITPAYAGKSFSLSWIAFLMKDHPRLRGEKSAKMESSRLQVGSPPLTRGKVLPFSTLGIGTRITPAYAGKSFG